MVTLFIKDCKGYELEKAKPNTSEDFFNKSEVTFEDNGQTSTFTVLYVRYFDEIMSDFVPFSQDPIFQVNSRPVHFKDIVALVCLMKEPKYRQRKKVYINSQKDFAALFQNINFEKVKSIFQSLGEGKSYELISQSDFTVQSK
jgi:hypothetical protein